MTSQDRQIGVLICGGHVAAEVDRVQAESLVKSIAVEQVVANQIAVTPPRVKSEARTLNAGLRGTTIALYQDGRQRDAVVSDQYRSWRHERRELLVQFERFEHHMRRLVASMVFETTQQPAIWQKR